MTPGAADLLLVIDVQVDFLPGGALPVRDGDAVVAPINALQHRFRHVVLMQDWHPADHVSFADTHPGRAPFETVALPYGPQVLWPRHCVQGSLGAGFAPGLATDRASLVVRKGLDPRVDSYSAFLEADRITRTGLAGALAERGITRVVLCGLATDFCVLWSALDARDAGFEVQVVEDAVRGIDVDGSLARAWARMEAAGVRRIGSAEIA
ncbi:MAG: bifunctional nicotinamidase/pyrazinamidase [Methylobacterium sp.]|uniref:bifunctional nicotinamidase/pyrazinamidase n=1 Tax=Methylobacterium sp. WL64 TaxID=2603894 RepID=UPI0011C7E143|nr:bifunctional nicotinamidase/pyrazinamidase [Methylobacterium sp. WL64]RZK97827.1 MAG: bifunctional nicotinamidase/pyrazinamidase [Methylobacterium sp.]TXM98225.1 bifunctional nicotinamidase/pyrazinamidase [Methylobacterium sp. WL64]